MEGIRHPKPWQSELWPHLDLIRKRRLARASWPDIAVELKNLGESDHPDTVGRFFRRAQSGKLPLGFEPEPRQAASPAEPLSTLPPIGPDATDPLLAEIAPNSPWAPRKPIGRKDREWLIG